MSAPNSLPSDPNLRQLKNQAKDLLKAYRVGDPEAANRLRQALPELADLSDAGLFQTKLALKDARRAVAHQYGCDDWAALKQQVKEMTQSADAPSPEFRALLEAIDTINADMVAHILQGYPHLATQQARWTMKAHRTDLRSLLFRNNPDVYAHETDAHLRIAQLLIDHGADMRDPALLAGNARGGNLGMVKLLLANGADPNRTPYRNETIVASTARHDHKLNNGQIVAALINAGAEYTLGDLVQAGLEERIIEDLDRDPALVNQPVPYKTDIRCPPLHAGLHTDFFHHQDDREVRMMALLLDRGAQIDAVDSLGNTALHRAVEHTGSHAESIRAASRPVIQLLLERGAQIDFFAAVGLGEVDRVAALLRQRPDRVHQQLDGKTPLHLARQLGHKPVADLLVASGADERAKTSADKTPLDAQADYLEQTIKRHLNGLDMRQAAQATDEYWAVTAGLPRPVDERIRLGALSVRAKLAVGDLSSARQHAESLRKSAQDNTEYLTAANGVQSEVFYSQGDWAATRTCLDLCNYRALYALMEAQIGRVGQAEHQLAAFKEDIRQEGDTPAILHPTRQAQLAFIGAWLGRILGYEAPWAQAKRLAQQVLYGNTPLSPLTTSESNESIQARIALGVIAAGQRDTASALEQYRQLRPYQGVMISGQPPVIDRVLGLLAHTLGRLDEAVAHFDKALVFYGDAFQPERAYACCEQAGVLLQRAHSDDRNRADTLLKESQKLAVKLDMEPLRKRIQGLQQTEK
ncbi:MAG: hypothetical protein GKR89_24675 [Candidatus Latescibacteria bacterium]|nr:hypothetical protein [Candidatus Latescibacterota bacterium]